MMQVNNSDVKIINFDDITTPQEIPLLVAFFDLSRFFNISQSHTSSNLFTLLSTYFEFVGDIIEASGGKVVKFIGDAGLIIYPEASVNQGVLALLDLQKQGDAWLANHHLPSRNIIQAHFGPVMCGPLGTRTHKHFDVIGQTINVAAKLNSSGIAITPQVFRQLNANTRKFFKKHTPPLTYIAVTDQHKD